jgi:hypothetical protein
MRARSHAISAALCVAALAVAVIVLWSSGGGWLSPPMRSWSGASRWYEEVGPDVAALALVRAAGLGVALWLLAGAVLQLSAAVLRGQVLQRVADLVAPRSLQRLVHGLAGISLSAGLAVTAPSAGIPADTGAGVAVMRPAEGPPDDPGTATMRVLDDAAPAPAPPPAVPATPAPAPAPAPDVVAVMAGDCFWSISAEVLADALGRPATEREVAAHWRRLVEANRGRLVDPGNPDLLYPGQQLVLPAPTP